MARRRAGGRLAGVPADAGAPDRRAAPAAAEQLRALPRRLRRPRAPQRRPRPPAAPLGAAPGPRLRAEPPVPPPQPHAATRADPRSEERRVGQERRSRWSPSHYTRQAPLTDIEGV